MPSPFVCVYQSRSFQAATDAGGWGQARCGATGSAVLTAVFVAVVLLARSHYYRHYYRHYSHFDVLVLLLPVLRVPVALGAELCIADASASSTCGARARGALNIPTAPTGHIYKKGAFRQQFNELFPPTAKKATWELVRPQAAPPNLGWRGFPPTGATAIFRIRSARRAAIERSRTLRLSCPRSTSATGTGVGEA
jgi:hypothetical protein